MMNMVVAPENLPGDLFTEEEVLRLKGLLCGTSCAKLRTPTFSRSLSANTKGVLRYSFVRMRTPGCDDFRTWVKSTASKL